MFTASKAKMLAWLQQRKSPPVAILRPKFLQKKGFPFATVGFHIVLDEKPEQLGNFPRVSIACINLPSSKCLSTVLPKTQMQFTKNYDSSKKKFLRDWVFPSVL